MVARSCAREADIWPGVNLNDPKSPEAVTQWLEAAIKQCNSPAGKLHRLLHGLTVPSSTPRQLFKSDAAEDQPNGVARATQIIKEINQKQKQIAATTTVATAAQELHTLKTAAVAAGIPPHKNPSNQTKTHLPRRLTNQHRRLTTSNSYSSRTSCTSSSAEDSQLSSLIGNRWTNSYLETRPSWFLYILVLILISESGCYNYATGISQPLNGSLRVFQLCCLVPFLVYVLLSAKRPDFTTDELLGKKVVQVSLSSRVTMTLVERRKRNLVTM